MIGKYKKIGTVIGLIIGLTASVSLFVSENMTKEIDVDRKAFNERINTEVLLMEENIREEFEENLEQEMRQEREAIKDKALLGFGEVEIGTYSPVAKELEKELWEARLYEDQRTGEFHHPFDKKVQVLHVLSLPLIVPGAFIIGAILFVVSLGDAHSFFVAFLLAKYYVWILYPILGFIIGFLLDKFFSRRYMSKIIR